MNVGKMRHMITIQRPDYDNRTTDEYGRSSVPWADFARVYAHAADVSGREFFEAAAHQMEDVVTFTFRWTGGVTAAMRILWEGREYTILQINHLGYKRDFMRIKARAVDAKGALTDGQH